MKISVSILKEINNFKETIDKINGTSADYIHLDIMDGTFTKETSFNLDDFINIKTNKKYDIHIMSTDLDKEIGKAIKLKPEFITFHYEATKDIMKYINIIKDNNIRVGLAINPETSIDEVEKYYKYIDQLLVMSVTPGKGGQQFIPSVINKLNRLNKNNNNFIISIDGGINEETINYVYDYVDMAVSGSYITSSEDYEKKIKILKK